jgi:hypothetical protein
VEYEEVSKPEKEIKLDLPPLDKKPPVIEQEPPAKKDNRYEELF